MGQWDIVLKSIRDSDVIVEVVDARVPNETRSEYLEKLVKKMGKRLVIAVNKTDLVPKEFEEKVRAEFKKEFDCVAVSTRERKGTGFLKGAVKKHEPKTVAIVGYPNTGKSSLINMLSHTGSAKTSPVPGYTKHAQWIRLTKGIRLHDTPGVIPADEKRSVFTSTIRPEKADNPIGYAHELIEKIKKAEGSNIEELYGIPIGDTETFIEELARKRNMMQKGEPDLFRVSRQIIIDWNTGKLSAWWM